MIVAIEGLDASGKASQTALLVERLCQEGIEVATMSFPVYETGIGRLIKRFLKDEVLLIENQPLVEMGAGSFVASRAAHGQALALQALMAANRYEVYAKLKEWSTKTCRVPHKIPYRPGQLGTTGEATKEVDAILVLDRYWLSGVAYGVADGLDETWLYALHEALPPAFWIYLDVTVEESFRRRPVREDAYEASRERLGRAREVYLSALSKLPMAVCDGGVPKQSVLEVHEQVWAAVKAARSG